MEPKSLSLELLPLEFKQAEQSPTSPDQADTVVGDPPPHFVPAAEEFALPKLEMVGFEVVAPKAADALPKLEMLEPAVAAPVSDPTPLTLAGDSVAGPVEAAAPPASIPDDLPPPVPVIMRPGTTSTVGPPTHVELAAIAEAAPNPDKFLAEAIKEITDGRRDNALWARAVQQGNGDEAVAIGSYMRARATALRVLERDQRAMRRAPVNTTAGVTRRKSGGLVSDEVDEVSFVAPPAKKSGVRFAPAIVGGLATLVVVGWFLTSWGNHADAAAEAAKRPPAASPASVAAAALAASAKSSGGASPEMGASPEFLAKVEALHAAGNWNVLVLHAVEWTRRDPKSAAAWNELSFGYAQLRQYRDAGDAAMKAVALSPTDPHYLANLGQIKLELSEPAEALRLFEQASAADELDVRSFVQAGILHAQMGHPVEARAALDRAMALGPDYPGALCLKAMIAQRPALQKEVSTTQPRQPDGKCVSAAEAQAVTVQAAPKQVARK